MNFWNPPGMSSVDFRHTNAQSIFQKWKVGCPPPPSRKVIVIARVSFQTLVLTSIWKFMPICLLLKR